MNRWSVALTLLAPVLSGCNPPSPTRAQPPTGDAAAPRPGAFVVPSAHPQASVVIEGVPHIKQKPDFCGEACVEMALRKLGHPLDQDEVFNRSGLDPAQGRGVATAELKIALERVGFDPGAVWSTVSASAPAPGLEAAFQALHDDLARGILSIVCMHFDDRVDTTEHFRLIVGYDAARDEVLYQEPAEDDGGYRRMPRGSFLRLWPLPRSQEAWSLIRLRLEPRALDSLARPSPRQGFSPADYAQHVLALRARIGPGFTVRVEPPFVVVGDLPAAAMAHQTEDTVRWAVTKLKQDFFTSDPASLLDVWLFKSSSSYEKNTLAIFGERPTTPYGFYSPSHKALIMNISTGGGTLVHEIVHPFVEANFPECPAWFNEGLGSLYEQAGEEGGHIHGYPNWRLPGLQRAVLAGQVPSFRALTKTTAQEFYNEDPGSNYGQARYLCYYLQEQGLLVRFYKDFHARVAEDPTGFAALKRVLGTEDMDAFKKRWETWVLGLSFPER